MSRINKNILASNIKSKSTVTNFLSKITNWFNSSSTPSKNNISEHNNQNYKSQLFNPSSPSQKQSANTNNNHPAKTVVQQIKNAEAKIKKAKADISHNQRATKFMKQGNSLLKNKEYKSAIDCYKSAKQELEQITDSNTEERLRIINKRIDDCEDKILEHRINNLESEPMANKGTSNQNVTKKAPLKPNELLRRAKTFAAEAEIQYSKNNIVTAYNRYNTVYEIYTHLGTRYPDNKEYKKQADIAKEARDLIYQKHGHSSDELKFAKRIVDLKR